MYSGIWGAKFWKILRIQNYLMRAESISKTRKVNIKAALRGAASMSMYSIARSKVIRSGASS